MTGQLDLADVVRSLSENDSNSNYILNKNNGFWDLMKHENFFVSSSEPTDNVEDGDYWVQPESTDGNAHVFLYIRNAGEWHRVGTNLSRARNWPAAADVSTANPFAIYNGSVIRYLGDTWIWTGPDSSITTAAGRNTNTPDHDNLNWLPVNSGGIVAWSYTEGTTPADRWSEGDLVEYNDRLFIAVEDSIMLDVPLAPNDSQYNGIAITAYNPSTAYAEDSVVRFDSYTPTGGASVTGDGNIYKWRNTAPTMTDGSDRPGVNNNWVRVNTLWVSVTPEERRLIPSFQSNFPRSILVKEPGQGSVSLEPLTGSFAQTNFTTPQSVSFVEFNSQDTLELAGPSADPSLGRTFSNQTINGVTRIVGSATLNAQTNVVPQIIIEEGSTISLRNTGSDDVTADLESVIDVYPGDDFTVTPTTFRSTLLAGINVPASTTTLGTTAINGIFTGPTIATLAVGSRTNSYLRLVQTGTETQVPGLVRTGTAASFLVGVGVRARSILLVQPLSGADVGLADAPTSAGNYSLTFEGGDVERWQDSTVVHKGDFSRVTILNETNTPEVNADNLNSTFFNSVGDFARVISGSYTAVTSAQFVANQVTVSITPGTTNNELDILWASNNAPTIDRSANYRLSGNNTSAIGTAGNFRYTFSGADIILTGLGNWEVPEARIFRDGDTTTYPGTLILSVNIGGSFTVESLSGTSSFYRRTSLGGGTLTLPTDASPVGWTSALSTTTDPEYPLTNNQRVRRVRSTSR